MENGMDQERIEEAVEAGEFAFWNAIADAFPEVETGDLPPDAADEFRRVAEKVIVRWLGANAEGKS